MVNLKPNVLWIFSDQHRSNALSYAGDKNINTPNFDALAQEGIRFTRAYSNCPLCAPFRATLYTGKYIHSHGVVSLDIPLIRQHKVLPEILQENGYYTSHMGKWHLCGGAAPDPYVSEYFRPGWDEWLGWENSNAPFDTYYSTSQKRNRRYKLEGYQTDGLTDLTIEWLKRCPKEKPWFHVISLEPPHPPNEAPEKYMEMFRCKELELQPNVPQDHPNLDSYIEDLRGYYAQIQNLDDNIGKIISTLRETNQLDNTIIFYFSDHGDLMGSHGMNGKSRPEEESINIPLIIKGPSSILPSGIVSDALISSVDFAPTLLGMLGFEVPAFMEGTDLSRTLFDINSKGAESVIIQHNQVFYKITPEKRFRTIITEEWKYSYFPATGQKMLYRLKDDPYEMDNLAENTSHAFTVKMLHEMLMTRLNEINDTGNQYIYM